MARNGASSHYFAPLLKIVVVICFVMAEFQKAISSNEFWTTTTTTASYYIAYKIEDCVNFCKYNAFDVRERNECIRSCVIDVCRTIHWKDLMKLNICVENLYPKYIK
ncbi:hypothetical protein PIB30_042397 [Stylosanthes scabra]|uniref:Uncharacterized protein n=1 Tax=Stylosanthes scabra TaxID=79078 RepID=A0ABU6XFJ3_9FABA|nr:hypothetical protein [Stylosanthes scabra]